MKIQEIKVRLDTLAKELDASIKTTRSYANEIRVLLSTLRFEPKEWTDLTYITKNGMLATNSNGFLCMKSIKTQAICWIFTEPLTPKVKE